MIQEDKEATIIYIKTKRKQWSAEFEELLLLQERLGGEPGGREIAMMITKHQEMKHWAGEVLNKLGAPNPYPNSKDPSNTIIDAPADSHRTPS